MKKIPLKEWKLRGYNNYVPLAEKNREINARTKGVTFDMDVTVPGSVYRELEKNGYIENPYYEMNSICCEWVANRWWVYYTTFEYSENAECVRLCLDGVDCNSHIFVNNKKIGATDNSFVGYSFDVTSVIVNGKNEIRIVTENAPDEQGQIGFSEKVFTQRPKYNYKWDFCARIVSVGIVKPVYLLIGDKSRITDVCFESRGDGGATITVNAERSAGCRITAEICGAYFTLKKGKTEIFVPDVKKWYPNGYGEQNLYELTVKLIKNGAVVDSKTLNVGFRNFELVKNENAIENSLPYTYVVNGRKVYIKGVSITPLDNDNFTENARYDKLLRLLKDANINFIRVWGGGVVESDYFYDRCDELGFIVLQDFTQSSTGITNITCKEKNYLRKLKETAVYSCVRLRSHVSLFCFDGGNELMDSNGAPVTVSDANIAVLKSAAERYAPHVYFYPSSASGISENPNLQTKGVNHDIHGPWKYTPNHYFLYNNLDSYFHGEFGVDGMSAFDSLKKFLSRENLCVTDSKFNLTWRHHGEWWDTYERDKAVFGEPQNLEEMISNSQKVQCEGIRYALEANRRRAFANSGSVIWQANECFPNVSSTALIDFYMQPKPALEQVKKAFSPLNVSLKYDKWIWSKGEEFYAEVFVTSDFQSAETCVEAEVFQNNASVLSKKFKSCVCDGYSEKLGDLRFNAGCGNIIIYLTAKNRFSDYNNVIEFIVK